MVNEVIGNSVIDNEGKLLFDEIESKNLINLGKVFYIVVFFNIGLWVILVVMVFIINSYCNVIGGVIDVLMGFIGFVVYFVYFNMYLV